MEVAPTQLGGAEPELEETVEPAEVPKVLQQTATDKGGRNRRRSSTLQAIAAKAAGGSWLVASRWKVLPP
jgi:hypothetical protein